MAAGNWDRWAVGSSLSVIIILFVTIVLVAVDTDGKNAKVSAVPPCDHEAKIAELNGVIKNFRSLVGDLNGRIRELEKERDKFRGDAEANVQLRKTMETQKETIASLEGRLKMISPQSGVICPHTGASVEDQAKARVVFDAVMRGVPQEDVLAGKNFEKRTADAFTALALLWGGEDKVVTAIRAAKNAVYQDLGPPPYGENYNVWKAKRENAFAAKLFDRFGHLPY